MPNINYGFEEGMKSYMNSFHNLEKLSKPEIEALADQYEHDTKVLLMWLRFHAQ